MNRFRSLAFAAALGLAATLLSPDLVSAQQPGESAADPRVEELEKSVAALKAEVARVRAEGSAAIRLDELEAKIDLLVREIETLRLAAAGVPTATTGGPSGLAPAASKVYALQRGVSVGGYGEVLYENPESTREDGAPSGRTAQVDMVRAILYFGYKFDDRWVFNSEIEYEHAKTAAGSAGEVAVEFAWLDWMKSPAFNLRGGLVLIPMGFVNELHEPPVYLGARRPMVERNIIPATWREIGVGAWGDFGPFTYRGYLVNGLDSSKFTAGGIRSARQNGSQAKAEDWALTGRLDWTGVPGILAGASFYAGDSAQGRETPDGESFDGRVTMFDLHAEAKFAGAQLRALWVDGRIDDVEEINAANALTGNKSVGERQTGWYLEAGYDLFSLGEPGRSSLVPFVRWEEWNAQEEVPAGFSLSPAQDNTLLTVGLSYRPIDSIVLKADWQKHETGAKSGVDQWNLAIGWLF